MSAYQVFCKEYRVTIVADHPGIGKNISHLSFFYFPFVSPKQCSSFSRSAGTLLPKLEKNSKLISFLSCASHFRFVSSFTPAIKHST